MGGQGRSETRLDGRDLGARSAWEESGSSEILMSVVATGRDARRESRGMGLEAARRCWLVGLATLVVLLGVTGVASATSTLYWYGSGDSTCWQTGQIGYPSEACDSVGSDFLTAEGSNKGGLAHMDEISSEGIGEDINLSADGDYCNYYKIGDDISRQETNNQGGVTGFTTPTPYGNYQESDGHGNVCQANGSDWGQEVGNG